MDLLINHLTRMRAGSICAAGLDLETHKHVRIAAITNLPTRLLSENGGPLCVGGVVRSKPTWRQPKQPRPQVEDLRFKLHKLKASELMAEVEYWKHLESVARTNLADLFEDLVPHGRSTYYVEPGLGNASLGCLKLQDVPTLYVTSTSYKSQTLRTRFTYDAGALDLPLTDIRLFSGDHFDIDEEALRRTQDSLQKASEVILSLGLTRAFPGYLGKPVHWLQVNNINVKPSGNA